MDKESQAETVERAFRAFWEREMMHCHQFEKGPKTLDDLHKLEFTDIYPELKLKKDDLLGYFDPFCVEEMGSNLLLTLAQN